MNNLPAEILDNIFNRLDLYDKLECTLVSRYWWRVLSEHSLFNYVEILYNSQLFEEFINKMEECSHYASQVEELNASTFLYNYVDKRDFLNIFPNAKVIKMKREPDPDPFHRELRYYSHSTTPIRMMHPTSKMRILHDSVYCELAEQMLVSNLGTKLEELELDFAEFDNDRVRFILDHLQNLPVLKKLVIVYPTISIMDLENIHKNVPTIQELRLRYIWIVSSEYPSNIVPASLITSLEINIDQARVDEENDPPRDDHLEIHCQLYQYMRQKYSNLTEVKHHNGHLVRYGSDNRRRVYLNGLLDFYTRVVIPVGGKLTIGGVPDNINIFEGADNVNAQLEEVEVYNSEGGTLFQYLVQSNQANYIKKLVLYNTKIGLPSVLKSLTSLVTLKLSLNLPHNSPPINFTEYLNGAPSTLKHLLFHCPNLEVNASDTSLSFIEILDISCRNIDYIAGVISSSFPKLVELKLSVGIFIPKDLNIELHMPTLQRATFHLGGGRNRDNFLSFKSLDQNEFQHYRIHCGRASSVPYEEIQNSPTLTVTTLTKKKVEISRGVKLLSI